MRCSEPRSLLLASPGLSVMDQPKLTAMKYYRKEIPESAVYIFGQPFRFDLLATEDVPLIHELDKCVRKQMGGVVEITKEIYDIELKKKEGEQRSSISAK